MSKNKGKNRGVNLIESAEETPSHNLEEKDSSEIVTINIKVDPDYRKHFKSICAQHEKKMYEVFKEGFELWKESRGIS